MINLNTNLSSLITQQSLAKSTLRLNQAIEQMTTGFKINHAKDNAANYNITTNMTTKIGAYMVAEDNCAMGLDLLATANGSLDQIADKLQRLRALAVQTSNGTYGEKSKEAINQEANAIVDEIERVYNITEYNGNKLFADNSSQNSETPFGMMGIVRLTEEEAIAEGYTIIKTADELQAINDDLDGKYILMNNIDLEGYAWTAVGEDYSNAFTGELNGNGYVISKLKIDTTSEYQGLFGYTDSGSKIKNLGLIDVNIKGGKNVGGLAGVCWSNITNCCVTGSVEGTGNYVGGLIGQSPSGSITSSYTSVNVTGGGTVGGIIGSCNRITINNCYATGNVTQTGNYGDIGGLVGSGDDGATIKNCYATGNVTQLGSYGNVGGLIGDSNECTTISSYATGDVTGGTYAGGLVGYSSSDSTLKNSYAMGSVSGNNHVGGLYGYSMNSKITDCACLYGTSSYAKTEEEIRATYTSESMGFTEDKGWTVVNDQQLLSWQKEAQPPPPLSGSNNVSLQIGANSGSTSQISLDISFALESLSDLRNVGLDTNDYLGSIDSMLGVVSAKQTEYGSVQNRLESALDEISVQYENLVSSRSTLRDADISEVSSEYIRQQILQQASATLMATANQSPSIALQLI